MWFSYTRPCFFPRLWNRLDKDQNLQVAFASRIGFTLIICSNNRLIWVTHSWKCKEISFCHFSFEKKGHFHFQVFLADGFFDWSSSKENMTFPKCWHVMHTYKCNNQCLYNWLYPRNGNYSCNNRNRKHLMTTLPKLANRVFLPTQQSDENVKCHQKTVLVFSKNSWLVLGDKWPIRPS